MGPVGPVTENWMNQRKKLWRLGEQASPAACRLFFIFHFVLLWVRRTRAVCACMRRALVCLWISAFGLAWKRTVLYLVVFSIYNVR